MLLNLTKPNLTCCQELYRALSNSFIVPYLAAILSSKSPRLDLFKSLLQKIQLWTLRIFSKGSTRATHLISLGRLLCPVQRPSLRDTFALSRGLELPTFTPSVGVLPFPPQSTINPTVVLQAGMAPTISYCVQSHV